MLYSDIFIIKFAKSISIAKTKLKFLVIKEVY